MTTVAAGHTATYVWADNVAQTPRIGVKAVSLASNGTLGTGVWGGSPTRVVSYAFEWSCIIDNFTIASPIRTDIMNRTIVWLVGHDHPDVVVTYPNGGEVLPGPTVTVTWTRAVYGGATVATQSLYYSPNAGAAWYLVTAAIAPAATTYAWNIAAMPRGTQYLVRMVVVDSGFPAGTGPLTGADDSNAVFTINTPDTTPPIVQPGSVTVTPNPVNGPTTTCWINGTVDDTTTGNSTIAAAEYFIDATGASGTGTAMVAVGTAFNTQPVQKVMRQGTLSLTNGVHTAFVHGRDSAGNWGVFETTTFQYIFTGPPPTWWYNATVVAGWNLVSLPIYNTAAAPLNWLFADQTGATKVAWDRLMYYDPNRPADPWRMYSTAWPAGFNDLTSYDTTKGVWLNVVTVGDGLICNGGTNWTHDASTGITLKAGWNMVGYPSNSTTYTVTNALAGLPVGTIFEGFLAAAPYKTQVLAGGYALKKGEGYWIYTPTAATWTVAW